VQAGQRGRVTQSYLEIVLSQSEDSFSSIQNSFDSIQPPDTARADQLRAGLDKLLSDGSDGLGQLRILGRRQDGAQLAAEAKKLGATADGLEKFAKGHG
jgi:hypothetical protein